ncbi:hypothetical protein KMT30_33445 [Streptomyces sp. IBSBF 2953]|uniref:hypothetical protein n=1 Tax=Streptomyces TaxID=1883 RepID=UPI00211A3519|nr:hypothetical protein [Streptomyces scabiei]MCQ9183862.1 hypothetical protein [Streptomyces hayashii]MDX3114073.1 hypothetical protein [Streptomyces scabiei]
MADIRRRFRSGTVVLGGVSLLATALTACSSDPDKRCVDRDSYTRAKGYKVIADKNCKSGSTSHAVWYYGGSKKGSFVEGGSLSKSGKGSGGSSSGGGSGGGVDRGGFGDGGHKGGSGG